VRVLRLAREYNLLPCEYINKKPRDPEIDYLLTMALDIHDKDLLCSCGCGFYRVDSHAEDADGWFEVADDAICFARAAVEVFQEDNPDLEPGTLIRVVDTRIAEAPVRTQRNTGGRRQVSVDDDTLG